LSIDHNRFVLAPEGGTLVFAASAHDRQVASVAPVPSAWE
jgi:hypothetical protein